MSEKFDACIAALGQTNPEDDRNALTTYGHKITEGTCQWILDDRVFQRWKSDEDSEQPLIWVCDRQGMGKTTLAIFISKYLEDTDPGNGDSWVLFYFCNREDESRNTAASILKGLMFQLCSKQESLAKLIYDEYRIQKENMFRPRSIEVLWRIFRAMVNASPTKRIFCVIDGVDQCHEPYLDHFLKKLNDYFTRHNERQASAKADAVSGAAQDNSLPSAQSRKLPELRVIVLSREEPVCVVEELGSFPRLTLRNSGFQTGESDLKRFIDATVEEVSTSCSKSKGATDETTQIITQVLDKGQSRSFLWVSLAAERLMGMKQSLVKKYAAQMPDNVEDFYIQTLLEIPLRQRPHASALLKWVAVSMRPLSNLELKKAIKYTLGTSFTKATLKKTIKVCPGLVRQQDKIVTLANPSVHDFLFLEQSRLRQSPELKDFVFDRGNVHSDMANTCVAYLQNSANLKRSRRVRLKPGDRLNSEDAAFLRKHPFLEYAVVHWTSHAKQGNVEKTNYDVPFFKDASARRRLWWESYWISLRQWLAWKWTAPGRFSLLHLAAFFNIVPLASYVARKRRVNELIGAEDHQGMKPINWATQRCSVEMVRFLLQHGDFDDEALRQAAQTGEASIIAMLLENRARLLRSPRLASAASSPTTPSSPFHALRKVTLSSLSDFSKRLDGTDAEKSTPLSPEIKGYGAAKTETLLHIAATCGHVEATEAFLKAGEDPHKATDGGWTPLHNAAWFGRASTVDCLFAAGADMTAETKDKLTPLHCAVKNSQPGAVERLLRKKGVEIEAQDQFGLTPFHIACKSNNILIMEILLDYGASIERRLPQGWTPLLWACTSGRVAVVQYLLKRGADVNVKWRLGLAEAGRVIELGPVGLARAYRHEAIARILEKLGLEDSSHLGDDEAKVLQEAETVQEEYHVPKVQDILDMDEGSPSTGGTPDAEDDESSADGDDESENGSELSDAEMPSRKQSASSMQDETSSRRKSSLGLGGLGIHEEVHQEATDDHPQASKAAIVQAETTPTREDVSAPSQSSGLGLDLPVESHREREAETHDSSDIKTEQIPTGQMAEEVPSDLVDGGQEDRRSSGTPKSPLSPGTFAGRFGRFVPKFARKDSVASSESPAPTEESPETPDAAVQGNGVADEVAESPIAERSKLDTKGLGRFGPKRAFSWKNEATSATSPEISISPETPLASSHLTVEDGEVAERARDAPVDEHSKTEAKWHERFGPKRLVGWKSESASEISKAATPSLDGIVEPSQSKGDDAEADTETNDVSKSPSAFGRALAGKSAFGRKKSEPFEGK